MELGYKINSNQQKCFDLVAQINEAFPMTKNGKNFFAARTEYKEGRGYYVSLNAKCGNLAEGNYYPKSLNWNDIVEYCKMITALNTTEKERRDNNIERLENIRSRLSENEQMAIGIHPNQDQYKNDAKNKLTEDEIIFIEGICEKWILI